MKRMRCFHVVLLSLLGLLTSPGASFQWQNVAPSNPLDFRQGDIAFGAGRFVMPVTGTIFYSDDSGLSWVDAHVDFPTNFWFGYAWIKNVNGTFFAGVPPDERLFISNDGIHWTSHRFPAGQFPDDVAFGAGKYVVTGQNLFASSSDTQDWTVVTPSLNQQFDVAYGNGSFLALSFVNAQVNQSGYRWVFRSTDGVQWTGEPQSLYIAPPNSPFEHIMGWQGLAFLPDQNLFITIGSTWSAYPGVGYHYYWVTTPNGTDWTVVPGNVTDVSTLNTFGVINGKPASPNIAFGNGVYISSRPIARSTDGIHFTPIPSPVLATGVSAAQSGNTIVQVGDYPHSAAPFLKSAATITYSVDGWTTRAAATVPDGSGPLASVRYANGQFVAVGAGGTILRSSDGIAWSKRFSGLATDLLDVAYGNAQWVAVGSAGKIATSADASAFTLRNSNVEVDINGIAFGDGKFVAVANSGGILTSSDGQTWAVAGTDAGKNLKAVAYGNGKFVAVGVDGIVHVSTDAVTWTTTTIGNPDTLARVAFGNGLFVACNLTPDYNFTLSTARTYISADGLHWQRVDAVGFENGLPPTPSAYGIDFSGGRFLLSGARALLATMETSFPNATTLRATASGNSITLTLDASAPGDYEIFSVDNLDFTSAQVRATVNAVSETTWTDPTPIQGTRFYEVRAK